MTIQGKKKSELTREGILELISSFDIYKHFFGEFKLNVICCNHLRGDKNPSFLIGTKYGEISHHDFANSEWGGDCFDLVQQIHSCDFDTALKIIDRDFGLNISCKGNLEYKKIISEYKQPEELGKRYSLIQCITRPFTKEELEYWNSYHQDIQDLRDNNIYSLKKVYLNKQLFLIKETELRFGYLYGTNWKIYFPNKEKKGKWISNVPLSTSWGLENLNKNYNSLGCKSLKDFLVCRKIFPYVYGVQNESLGAFSEEAVKIIKNNSKIAFYGGDSDKPGKEASYAITNSFGFKHINPEDRLLPKIKDFSDWAKEKDLKAVENHFIKKGLFG